MNTVNRGLLVIKPRLPFVEWINSTGGSDETISFEDARRDSAVYLIPELSDDKAVDSFLMKNYSTLFEQELAAWFLDEKGWPEVRDFRTFLEWFEVEFHSVVYDIAEDELPLMIDES